MKTKITLFFSVMLMVVFGTLSVHAQTAITFDGAPTEVTADASAIVKVNYTKGAAGAWAQVKLRNAANEEVAAGLIAITESSGSIEFDMAIPASALGADYHWWAQIMNASWGGEGTVAEPFPSVTVLPAVVYTNGISFVTPPAEVTAGTTAVVEVSYTKDAAGAWAQVKLRNAANEEIVAGLIAITEPSGSIEFDMAIPASALGADYHWWAQIMNESWGGEATVAEPFPSVTVLPAVVYTNGISFVTPPAEVTAGTTAVVEVSYTKDAAGAWAQVKLRNAANEEIVAGLIAITEPSGSIEFDMAIPASALGADYHWWAQIMNESWGGEATVAEPFPSVTVLPAAEPVYTIDFEVDGIGADWTWGYCCNGDDPALEFVDNPSITEPNLSAKVAKFTSRVAGDTWRLFLNSGDNGEFTFDADNSIIKMMVYKTDVSSIGFKVEGATGTVTTVYNSNTLVDAWEEIEFDFTALIGQTFSAFVIMPDGAVRTEDAIVYLDNIILPQGGVANPVYNVTFTVVDVDANVVADAAVLLLGTTVTTDASGVAVFTDLDPVTDAAYTVSKVGFLDATGTVSVVDADVEVDVDLISSTLGINSDLSMISNVYPNPTDGKLNIELNNSFNKAEVTVYSSHGQIIEHKELFEMHSVIDLSAFKAGIYLIRVELDDQMYLGKIVLNR